MARCESGLLLVVRAPEAPAGVLQDGAAIQKAGHGARTAAIVCGTRYIHTVTESIDKKDLQATIDLLAAWLPTVK